MRKVQEALGQNQAEVLEAAVSAACEESPHRALLQGVARRVSDRKLLRLIKVWRKAPVAVRDTRGPPQLTGGQRAKRGVPPGGALTF